MFPDELKNWPQWVLWRKIIKPDGAETKLPFNPHNNAMASVTDPLSWSTFDVAAAACQQTVANGIGFVLTKRDPYTVIDLDNPCGIPEVMDRHAKILQTFNSYSELSPSQEGVHIWCKGSVPSGRRRGKVEIYSSDRYMTVTGQTIKQLPIEDRSGYVKMLWEEIDGNEKDDFVAREQEEKYTDREIWEHASQAKNGDLFDKLWSGHWAEAGYASQSEADFALVNILGFYSRNREQIKRLFFSSALGQRPKSKRKAYLDTMIQRSFDNQPTEVDLTEVIANAKVAMDVKSNTNGSNPFAGPLFASVPDVHYDPTRPPGLLGDIADFIYQSAIRPVREMGLAAAIGLMAGICGRQYNVSETGLNQYVLLLAGTGTGKEAVKSGIDKLMQSVRTRVPAAMEYIGPAQIASGQALIRHVSTHPCFLSIVGEFGLKLHQMSGSYANPAQEGFRAQLLDLYNKSGERDLLQQMIYSDKEKNTKIVQSPAFSLLGESTPDTYYSELDDHMIAQGLLPRFLCIEYHGERVLTNPHQVKEPSNELITRLAELTANCLLMSQSNRVIHVQLDDESKAFRKQIDKSTTDSINRSDLPIAKNLWNRAELKTLKTAALIAIGIDFYNPIIKLDQMQWAYNLVEADIKNVFGRFERGQIGTSTNEGNQVGDAVDIVREYLVRPVGSLKGYGIEDVMHTSRVITWSYLLNRLQQKGSFRRDKFGAKMAIQRTLDTLEKEGAIKKMKQWDMKQHFNSIKEAYAITDVSRFMGVHKA